MKHYAVYLVSGNRMIIRAESCEHTSGNMIIFKINGDLDMDTGVYNPEQIVGIFNFNNIEGIECLGEIKE